MAIKILLLLLLVSACGRDVKLTNSLEKNSFVNSPSEAYNQSGTLVRKTTASEKDRIVIGGSSYNVSISSSYSSLEFIAALPLGTQVNVKFKGKASGSEILLESMTNQ